MKFSAKQLAIIFVSLFALVSITWLCIRAVNSNNSNDHVNDRGKFQKVFEEPTINKPSQTSDDPNLQAKQECENKVEAWKTYLQQETLSDTETFTKYPVTNILDKDLKDLNTASNQYANLFRGVIRDELKTKGVNFAGKYTIADLGMTGYGTSHFIIDRSNGNAYIFPYFAEAIDFKEDSNLIVVNPKATLLKFIAMSDAENNPGSTCFFEHQQEFTDLRPFYFLWQNDQLILIGPKDIQPVENAL